MTAQSYTGRVNTEGEYVSVEELSGITFVAGTVYSIQIQNLAYWKVGDAEFTIYTDDVWGYKAGSDVPYIKTDFSSAVLTILEGE